MLFGRYPFPVNCRLQQRSMMLQRNIRMPAEVGTEVDRTLEQPGFRELQQAPGVQEVGTGLEEEGRRKVYSTGPFAS